MKFLSAGVLSQNPELNKRRWRKRKTQRSQEKLARWIERRIQFHSHEGVAALNQTEAAKDLKWGLSTVQRHWKASKGILEANGYIFNRVHDKSRCARNHRRSKNPKLIWYGYYEKNMPVRKLFERNKDGKNRHLRDSSGARISGINIFKLEHTLPQNGGYIGGFVNNKAQKNLKPCSAALPGPTSFEKNNQKAVWKLDRLLRTLPWDNCKVDLLPTHTHSLAQEAFKLRLRMESVVEMANKILHKWHGIATDNGADGQNLWLSSGWLVDCRKELASCQKFTPNPLPFFNVKSEVFSEEELRIKIFESFYETTLNQEKEEQLLTHVS